MTSVDPASTCRIELRPMQAADLDAVLVIENLAYSHPWSRGNFIDSLAAGHEAWLLEEVVADTPRRAERPAGKLCAYYLAMPGYEEMHLLNITVAPELQGRGLARRLLSHLEARARVRDALMLWLEVRPSNARARALYEAWGFQAVGLRKGYYPSLPGQREDAIVMNRALPSPGFPPAAWPKADAA